MKHYLAYSLTFCIFSCISAEASEEEIPNPLHRASSFSKPKIPHKDKEGTASTGNSLKTVSFALDHFDEEYEENPFSNSKGSESTLKETPDSLFDMSNFSKQFLEFPKEEIVFDISTVQTRKRSNSMCECCCPIKELKSTHPIHKKINRFTKTTKHIKGFDFIKEHHPDSEAE